MSSKNPFRTRYGINSGDGKMNGSSSGNDSYILQRNHDQQRTQSDQQRKYDVSPSSQSPNTSKKNALSELVSSERGTQNNRYPPLPGGGTRPPPPQYTNTRRSTIPPLGQTMGGPPNSGMRPPPPQYANMTQSMVPPPRPTMGERMPPRQGPPQQQSRGPPPRQPPLTTSCRRWVRLDARGS